MKKILFRTLLAVSVAIGIVGCGTPYQFSPYVGQQKNWTTSAGSYVRYVENVPVYAPGQYPNRPYVIVGAVSTDSEGNLIKAVHEQRADAALISHDTAYPNGAVTFASPGVVWTEPTIHHVITANLIRFR
jgi:hypothetical protein